MNNIPFINYIRHLRIPILRRVETGRGTRFPGSSSFLAVLLAITAGYGSAVNAGLLDGLQLHVGFENAVVDSSANGFDGQANGDLQYGNGVIGQAAVFDGVDDQVLFPTFTDALISDNDFTIAYWFNLPSSSIRSVFGKREICGLGPFIDIRVNAINTMRLELSNGGRTWGVGVQEVPPGWHHVAYTRSGTDFQAFLDARLVDEASTPEIINFQNTAILGVSNSPCTGLDGTLMLDGSLDDLRVYNRRLSAAEIRELVNIFADGFESLEP